MPENLFGSISGGLPSGGAVFSGDRVYRYRLWRRWSDAAPPVAFCLLNPSTADETKDDPTIRRCIGFARRWGYGGVIIVNLFALRSTDPVALYGHSDPIGPDNDAHIDEVYSQVPEMIAAWGCHGAYRERGQQVALRHDWNLSHLGKTKGGHPKHPLYLPNTAIRAWYRPNYPGDDD